MTNSVGNPGNSGAAGGQAGSKGGNSCGNGGPAGRAVYKNNGNNYTVSGGSSNKLKGSTLIAKQIKKLYNIV